MRNHITSIFDKIGVESRAQAIVLARERGLGQRSWSISGSLSRSRDLRLMRRGARYGTMGRLTEGLSWALLAFLYGAVSYAIFLVVFLYAIAFVGNLPVPKTIDSGAPGPLAEALLVNAAAARPVRGAAQRDGAAGVQALVDAHRAALGRAQHLRAPGEPALALLYWQWRPIAGTVWQMSRSRRSHGALYALFALGWLIVLLSTFMINHFDLFGLRQVWLRVRDADYTEVPFVHARVLQLRAPPDHARLPHRLLGRRRT